MNDSYFELDFSNSNGFGRCVDADYRAEEYGIEDVYED